MQISTLKSQKTSGGLANLHANDWEEEGRIGIGILHLVFRHFQGSDQGPAGLKKRSQYKEPSFCPPIGPQDLKNQY